jgi:hypothetical protein
MSWKQNGSMIAPASDNHPHFHNRNAGRPIRQTNAKPTSRNGKQLHMWLWNMQKIHKPGQ